MPLQMYPPRGLGRLEKGNKISVTLSKSCARAVQNVKSETELFHGVPPVFGWGQVVDVPSARVIWRYIGDDRRVGATKPGGFCAEHSAYICKFDQKGLCLVDPEKTENTPNVLHILGYELKGMAWDLLSYRFKCFDEKVKWFHNLCWGVSLRHVNPKVQLSVRRNRVLEDSARLSWAWSRRSSKDFRA